MIKTYAYGYPRLGKNREYKKSIESFWKDKSNTADLQNSLDQLQQEMIQTYSNWVDFFPVGEMTGYDHMLDTAIMFGLYDAKDSHQYYELCRGKNALEMTKWFNTNYHYLVPDFSGFSPSQFVLNWNKPQEYIQKFKEGIPYLIGPFTFLKLSKGIAPKQFHEHLISLGHTVKSAIKDFQRVHMDEPAFALDLSTEEVASIKKLYETLAESGSEIYLSTYYDSVDFIKELFALPIKAIGLDFVHGSENLQHIDKYGFPDDKILVAGVVDGRNVWKTDIREAVERLQFLSQRAKHLIISNASPLYHVPITIIGETLDPRLIDQLAFAEEKLAEIQTIARVWEGEISLPDQASLEFAANEKVKKRMAGLKDSDFERHTPYSKRSQLQTQALPLPLLPTTTIGSFPQTAELRKTRIAFRTGKITREEYEGFINKKIAAAIHWQEEIGLDVLVHGEFERSDMVEFFAQKLQGIATTKNGWIISYGSRGYRPPIIYGDVSRTKPMTVKEIAYAQSLTQKPVKGILTGPVTIIAWSYIREDIPVSSVAYQLALVLRDEITDLEKAGIRLIQVDEPAFREKAPNKKRDWEDYFGWAIKAFRLATAEAKAETQIHSHMCYSEFGEIINQIAQMDFDVISIEATRSRGNLLESFEKARFDRKIGLGVWDIHSPAVPAPKEMETIIRRALKVIPKENFWVNPDCGLKTRGWEEIEIALKNMATTATQLREMFSS